MFFKFSGFKKGGIYPFNRNVIQNSTYDPAALKRFEAHKKSIAIKVDEPEDPEICLNADLSQDAKSFDELLLNETK
jgi:hypothetical protein